MHPDHGALSTNLRPAPGRCVHPWVSRDRDGGSLRRGRMGRRKLRIVPMPW